MAWLSTRRPVTCDGLLPVVMQNADDGHVLMVGWANEAALEATERTGQAHFWSRSRNELWRKGATSGNVMDVVDLATDCDGDAVLYRVRPAGPACHTGAISCFEAELENPPRFTLARLERVIDGRRSADPRTSYTARLLEQGPRRAGEKVVEEAGEVLGAATAGSDDEVREEAADLLYHLLVVLAARGVTLEDVERILAERRQ